MMYVKDLILSLIRDDLLNHLLLHGLDALGFDASDYMLHLGTTVLDLMGYDKTRRTDALYNRYYALAQRAQHINVSESKSGLDVLAAEIYVLMENTNPVSV